MDDFSTTIVFPANSSDPCLVDETLSCAASSPTGPFQAHVRANGLAALASATPVNEDRPDPTQMAGYCIIA
ncbi:hypothetical protein ACG7TL_007532 [Trametes sanguinea]